MQSTGAFASRTQELSLRPKKATEATGSTKTSKPKPPAAKTPPSHASKPTRTRKPKPSSPAPPPAPPVDTEIHDETEIHAAITADNAKRRQRRSYRKDAPLVIRFNEADRQEFCEVHRPGTSIQSVVRRFIDAYASDFHDEDVDVSAFHEDRLVALIRFRPGAAPTIWFTGDHTDPNEELAAAADAYLASAREVIEVETACWMESAALDLDFLRRTGLPKGYSPEVAKHPAWQRHCNASDAISAKLDAPVRRRAQDEERLMRLILAAVGRRIHYEASIAENLVPCAVRIGGRTFCVVPDPDNRDDAYLHVIEPCDFVDFDPAS